MKDHTNLFNVLANFYKQEEPYVYALSHYVGPMVVLSIILGGLLNKVGTVHPLCSIFLFLGAVSASVVIFGISVWDHKKTQNSQSNN